MTFEQLNVAAFWENPKDEFERVAGPRPTWDKDYDDVNSSMKRKLLWNFFKSSRATEAMLDSKSVYSGHEDGVTIREMLNEMGDGDNTFIHSIEHVIPKANYIRVPLNARRPTVPSAVINGATLNPMNFLPSHASVNNSRREKHFDFQGDVVASVTLAMVDGEARRFEGGEDEDGEWVPPIVSRGDVARCVVFMELMYRLDYVDELELLVLQKWMKEDEPSDFETQFGLWIRETMPLEGKIQNPFVSHPELATNDEMFFHLVKAMLNKDLPRTRGGSSTGSSSVAIDSVLHNPSGYDTSGNERVTLRNMTDTTISLTDWVLEIKAHHSNEDKTTKYSCTGVTLHGGECMDVWFPDDNVLPNSCRTTINLLDNYGALISTFSCPSNAPRSGKMLARL